MNIAATIYATVLFFYDNYYFIKGVNCTKEEMQKAVQGHLTTEALILNQDNQITIAGTTSQEWLERYVKELQKISDVEKPEGFLEAPLAYDAIWAIAFALNNTIQKLERQGLSLESFNYTNNYIKDILYNSLANVQFLGVSGHVAFSEKGDRIAWTQIEQMIEGKYNLLGYYDTQTNNLTWTNNERWVETGKELNHFLFSKNRLLTYALHLTGKPPPDRTIIQQKYSSVNTSLFITIIVISLIGILWALALMCFNLKFSHYRLEVFPKKITFQLLPF